MSTYQTTNENKQQLKIDITSDNICPWCYIGKRRLEKALSQINSSDINSSLSLSPLLAFLDPYSYVLVLNVGSIGTRIHIYEFRATTDNENGDTFVLKDEIFRERKSGLSSFADHVYKSEEQINDLLKIADQEVSRFKHRNTPLVLRATAGLRLLNETKEKLLLEGVSNRFGKYGFYRPKKDIAIMNETEEGIDAWLTLVYLKGEQFYGSRIATLDLGGGST
ncbi:unnamed protein product [Rotaria sp. Silwood2]|nr:unnamed protein product [Rotaria sp. Silwood2]